MDIPVHIGIIMDGNGRWAQKRGLVRTQGHLEGLKAAKRIVKAASDLGVKYITLYAFSTENWKRTSDEVNFIFGLIKQFLKSDFDFSKKNRIRVRYTGDMEKLPSDIQDEINDTIMQTKDFDGMQVALAINYGGRDEIVRALRRFKETNPDGAATESDISAHLDNPDIPEPDLIIRSASEYRTSNFLLWQAAYSEIFVSPKLWPDWEKEDLEAAIENYQKRERRYGGIKTNGSEISKVA
ncbi:MAG: di-trans,poly-cis-decaprenylcistransferase [Treponema sp.]|jgi:undecaprenyl diphosphate synthase|nr:di-trans,poly-cis-decaprenylcistransferase [Treponema sp.]